MRRQILGFLLFFAMLAVVSPATAQAGEPPEVGPRCFQNWRTGTGVSLSFENIDADTNNIVIFQDGARVAWLRGSETSWEAPDTISIFDGPFTIKLRPSREKYDCTQATSLIRHVDLGDDSRGCTVLEESGNGRRVWFHGDFGDATRYLRSDAGWIANVTGLNNYRSDRVHDEGLFLRLRKGGWFTDIACELGGLTYTGFKWTDEYRPHPDLSSLDNANFAAHIVEETLFVTNKTSGEVQTYAITSYDFDLHSISEDGTTVWWFHEFDSGQGYWADLSTLEIGAAVDLS